jgi:hypothetical protein
MTLPPFSFDIIILYKAIKKRMNNSYYLPAAAGTVCGRAHLSGELFNNNSEKVAHFYWTQETEKNWHHIINIKNVLISKIGISKVHHVKLNRPFIGQKKF